MFRILKHADHALENSGHSPKLALVVSLLLLILITAFSAYNERTPDPIASRVSDNIFSARRACAALQSIYRGDYPHPTGSAEQQRIGDRLIDYLRKLGYTPEVQEVLVTTRSTHLCASVRNIIVRLKGVRGDHGILITAHYDSVPCGPGGMDDGVGVATILELARVLKHAPRPDRPVFLLLSDGEELGLLGAKAFIERHPWARKVQFTIGVDSGGDGGRCRVTEISGNEALWVETLSRQVRRPLASSAILAVLSSLNIAEGTSDFEEFKRAGKTGINLINSAWNYQRHTPGDNIAHINLGTLQDHGDHVTDLINGLTVGKQAIHGTKEMMIFFDFLGSMFLHYNQIWAWILQGLSLMIVVLIGKRFGLDHLSTGLRFLGKWCVIIMTGAIGGGVVGYFLVNLPQMPFLLKPALILMTAVCVEMMAFRYLRAGGAEAWVAWNLLGTITCIMLPGASYLFSIPALAMGLSAWVHIWKAGHNNWRSFLWPFGLAALLWIPLYYVLIQFGSPFYLISLPMLVVFELILPLFKEVNKHCYRISLIGLLILIVLAPIYLWIRPIEPRPRDYANITYLYQTNQRRALWILPTRSVPTVWKSAGRVYWRKIDYPMIKVTGKIPIASAPLLNHPPPVAIIKNDISLNDGKRRLVLYLKSQSNARILRVSVRPRPDEAKVNGLVIPSLPSNKLAKISFHRDEWEQYQFVGKITRGMTLEIMLPSSQQVDLVLTDQVDGLPTFGRKLLHARPFDVIPAQNGDLTLIAKTYRFKP